MKKRNFLLAVMNISGWLDVRANLRCSWRCFHDLWPVRWGDQGLHWSAGESGLGSIGLDCQKKPFLPNLLMVCQKEYVRFGYQLVKTALLPTEICLELTKFCSYNKLASLEVTLVQNYDPPIHRRTRWRWWSAELLALLESGKDDPSRWLNQLWMQLLTHLPMVTSVLGWVRDVRRWSTLSSGDRFKQKRRKGWLAKKRPLAAYLTCISSSITNPTCKDN